MLQHRAYLLDGNAGEPLYELMGRRVVFEVLEESSHWHARATEHPGAAHAGRVTLDGSTCRPINHAVDGSTGRVWQ